METQFRPVYSTAHSVLLTPRHGRNLLQLKARHKHRRGSHAAPAVHFPLGAEELYLRAQGDVQYHFCGATIELLGNLEKRLPAKVLAIGRAPDGYVERFLLELVRDGEKAEEGARLAGGNIKGLAVGIGLEFGAGGDHGKIEGHSLVPFPIQQECNTTRKTGVVMNAPESIWKPQKIPRISQAWRLARRASAAARVSSFLQKVKRTWEAPSAASL
jgi:hypothetical protein